MRLDNLSIPVYSDSDIFELIYQNKINELENLMVDPSDEIEKFNSVATEMNIPKLKVYQDNHIDINDFDRLMQSEWFMPDSYKNLDIRSWMLTKLLEVGNYKDRASAQASKKWYRCMEELDEYEKRGMDNLLRYMIYLVDFMRENNIVWGVGRGSSVASYVLYLIGVHKIDSIKYNLDFKEFFR